MNGSDSIKRVVQSNLSTLKKYMKNKAIEEIKDQPTHIHNISMTIFDIMHGHWIMKFVFTEMKTEKSESYGYGYGYIDSVKFNIDFLFWFIHVEIEICRFAVKNLINDKWMVFIGQMYMRA